MGGAALKPCGPRRCSAAAGSRSVHLTGVYSCHLAACDGAVLCRDVQAIHWASYDGAGGSYRDELVCRRIRAHNLDCYSESRRR